MAPPGEPFFPAGFDPLNVLVLEGEEVLHGRWLELAGEAGELEVLDGQALTVGRGPHPLFDGVERVTITGIQEEPRVTDDGDGVRLLSNPLSVSLGAARVEREGRTVTLRALRPDA